MKALATREGLPPDLCVPGAVLGLKLPHLMLHTRHLVMHSRIQDQHLFHVLFCLLSFGKKIYYGECNTKSEILLACIDASISYQKNKNEDEVEQGLVA